MQVRRKYYSTVSDPAGQQNILFRQILTLFLSRVASRTARGESSCAEEQRGLGVDKKKHSLLRKKGSTKQQGPKRGRMKIGGQGRREGSEQGGQKCKLLWRATQGTGSTGETD